MPERFRHLLYQFRQMFVCVCVFSRNSSSNKKRHNIIILIWMVPFGARMCALAFFCHCFMYIGFVRAHRSIISFLSYLCIVKLSWWMAVMPSWSTEVLCFRCLRRWHFFIHIIGHWIVFGFLSTAHSFVFFSILLLFCFWWNASIWCHNVVLSVHKIEFLFCTWNWFEFYLFCVFLPWTLEHTNNNKNVM